MAEDLSLGDRKAVQAVLEAHKGEEQECVAWVTHFKSSFAKGGGGKSDKRIIVVGRRRVFILSRGKLEKGLALLDLKAVNSKSPGEAELEFSGLNAKGAPEKAKFAFQCDDEITDDIINGCIGGFHAILPAAPVSAKPAVNVSPESRVPDVEPPEASLGGIADAYMAFADHEGATVREDFQWDFESVWAPANLRTFNVKELEQVGVPDFRALMKALKFNPWFTTLVIDDVQYGKDYWDSVADCLEVNNKLEVLRLDEVGMKRDDLSKLATAMSKNKELQVNSISIRKNQVDDKGMGDFGTVFLAKMSRGLIKLDVTGCQVKAAGMANLCKGLKANAHMSATLTTLSLAENQLSGDASAGLSQFLSNPNQLVSLNLSNCGAKLSSILAAMLRGCKEIQTLNLADNQLSGKSDTQSLTQFIKGSTKLVNLDLAATGAGPDAAVDILKSLSSNAMLSGVSIGLARNKLGVAGARAIAKVGGKLSNIEKLDVAENGFGDEGVTLLAKGLCDAPKLLTLDISRNFDGPFKSNDKRAPQRAAMMSQIFEELCDVNDSKCPIENLIMAGDKSTNAKGPLSLGADAREILYSMTTNEQIKMLDVSGHGFGDNGASAAGRMVTTNEHLETFYWDDNSTGLDGLQSFFRGLRKNNTLTNSPLPINDIAAAMKGGAAAKVQEIVSKIETKLRFNQSPTARFASGSGGDDEENQGGSSTFAFMSSAGREEVQKVVFRLKAHGRPVPEWANAALEDAANQDAIMTDLYGIKDALAQEAEVEMRRGLTKAAEAAYPVFDQLKGRLVQELVKRAGKGYKSLQTEEGKQEVKRLGTNLNFGYSAKDLDQADFEQVLVGAASAELANRANMALHGTVTVASDYLYEKLAVKLQEALDEINIDIATEKGDAEAAAVAAASGGKKRERGSRGSSKVETPRKSSKSDKSDKSEKSDKPPKTPSKSSKPAAKEEDAGPPVDLAKVEVVESNLEHVTKARAAGPAARRPPTRKRRPAPPPASSM